jgi:hypothetical protein
VARGRNRQRQGAVHLGFGTAGSERLASVCNVRETMAAASEANTEPQFPKPKILLVDLPEEATRRLESSGFNVQAGTFGRPYRVQKCDEYSPVIAQAHLPNYTEQEVIIIDLTRREPTDGPEGTKAVAQGEMDWYARCSWGLIDPRPRVMAMVSDDWNRILQSGGVFVVFAQPRLRQELVFANARYGMFDRAREIHYDNWSFLPIFSRENFKVESDHGTESLVPECVDFLERFLRSHQAGLEFQAVLTPMFNMTHEGLHFNFCPLIHNKFGETIGGLVLAKKPRKGHIFILPQVNDKVRAVYELVTTILPELCRHLFPFFEGDRWVHSDEYEHESVLERRAEQQKVRSEAEARIVVLENEIEAEGNKRGFLHGILTGTGDRLVGDVQEVLRLIGFKKVEAPQEEAGLNKQEDLQINDRSPCLLLEVKGLAGLPTEADTHQGTKYVLRRMKEWQRTDINGVFVVNHQRNLPALERENEKVFTEQQLSDAVENGMALTTSWDLFRLARGMMRWGWPGTVVQEVFYGKGRLPSVPSHYAAAGTVAHFYSEISVLSIDVAEAGLRMGDTVGFLFPAGFVEEKITSLHVNKQDVSEARTGQRAGFKTTLKRKDLPVGTTIYVVRCV